MRTPCRHFPCFYKLLAQLALSSLAAFGKGRERLSLLPVPTSLWLWGQTGSSRTSSQGHFPAPSCPAHRRCRVDVRSLSLALPHSLFILASPPSWRTGLPRVFKFCHTRCHDGRLLSCGGGEHHPLAAPWKGLPATLLFKLCSLAFDACFNFLKFFLKCIIFIKTLGHLKLQPQHFQNPLWNKSCVYIYILFGLYQVLELFWRFFFFFFW